MFKYGGFEQELFQSMSSQLRKNQLDNKFGFDKLAQAADLLNAAATLFEEADMVQEANEVERILQGLADQLSSK